MCNKNLLNIPCVVNFGCRLNACESEKIEEIACELGLSGFVIINSCAVTAEAERQVKQYIRKIHNENPSAKIIITGCASENDAETFSKMEGVVGIIENSKKLDANSYIKYASSSTKISKLEKNNVRAFVQIQNGCDNACTYCIVRKTRGSSISFHPETILADIVDRLNNESVKEIVLTGVNISSYNFNGLSLANLCRFLLRNLDGLKRLRLSSLDPADLDDDFIVLFKDEDRMMPHIHLSIQSGDDMVLRRMLRRHSRDQVIHLINKVRSVRPDVVFGADFIAGFPTETDEMFQNTYDFIKECNIQLCHIFPYSERPGTAAACMPQVDKKIRRQRARELIRISDEILEKKLRSYIGKLVTVLAETDHSGKTDNFLHVETEDVLQVGRTYNMFGVDCNDGKLIAKVK